jgi:DNA polymerase sigma
MPIWAAFLRLTDKLVANAHFRPEIMRKVKAVREDEMRRIAKIADEEESEKRKEKADKDKREKRDALLKNMSSAEQKKFLEKEREKGMRKSQKRMTMR